MNCAAHNCQEHAVYGAVCWFHENTKSHDWPMVTEGLLKHSRLLQTVSLLMTQEGRIKLENKFGSLEKAAHAASEGLADPKLAPHEEDYVRVRYVKDIGEQKGQWFSWYRYMSRLRSYLLTLCQTKEERKSWAAEYA